MVKRTTSIAIVFTALFLAEAHADVSVSPVFITEPIQQHFDVPAGRSIIVPLPGGNVGDRYLIEVSLANQVYKDISAFVLDANNLMRFQRREKFSGEGKQKAVAPFRLEHAAQTPGPRHLILDNSYALLIAKKVSVTTRMARVMPQEHANQLREGIEKTYVALKKIFVFPDFDIAVRPCGEANAFSVRATGDITMCTETISKAAGRQGAFLGILFHELGHTLLNLWKLPGSDHEDMADEFAVQLLMRGNQGKQHVQELAEFFSGGNPWLEARFVIQQGDRHTLSPQRIRNFTSWAQNASELLPRWNRLLYPNMTTEALRAIAERPGPHDDADLGRQELVRRGAMPR